MNVGFIGMGNMGQMLVTALVRSKALEPGAVYISSRTPDKLARVAAAVPGVQPAPENAELARCCETIFLCLKPGETATVLSEIGPYITPDHLLVTICNAIEIRMLERSVPARVAKVIPSVAQAVQAGVSLLAFGSRCTDADRKHLSDLFRAISHPIVIDEAHGRVASNLTSCGPAFLSFVFRAMAQAARHYQPDLPPDTVAVMIRQTAEATCALLERQDLTFDDVITKVSTPGGVTADGIKVLEEMMTGVWEQVFETTIVKENAKKAKIGL